MGAHTLRLVEVVGCKAKTRSAGFFLLSHLIGPCSEVLRTVINQEQEAKVKAISPGSSVPFFQKLLRVCVSVFPCLLSSLSPFWAF